MDNTYQAQDVGNERRDAAWLAERSAFEGRAANQLLVPDPTKIWNPDIRLIQEDLEKAAKEMRASRKASDRYNKWPESRKRIESCNESCKWQRGKDRGQRLVETAKALAFRVSLDTYERALRIMNALALAADARGYSIHHDKDAGRLMFIGHDSEIQVRIAELLVRRHRLTTRYDGKAERESYMEPTGRLRISLQVGYGEGPTFDDQGTGKLESNLNRIFITMYGLTVKCWQRKRDREANQRQLEEAQRQRAEAERVRAEQERRAADERKRRDRLLQETQDWELAKRIHQYVSHIRAAANAAHDSCVDAEWMEWALGVAEALDPTALRLKSRRKTGG